ncbi:MAG: sterol desaturase family protein [Acidimicrobiales bacterium]
MLPLVPDPAQPADDTTAAAAAPAADAAAPTVAGAGRSGPTPRPTPADDLAAALRLFTDHATIRLLLVETAALVATRPLLGRLRRRDVAVAAGVIAGWPFLEWTAHKLVLHAKPRSVAGHRIDPAVARYHRAHHADPWDLDLTLLPMWFLVPTGPLLAAAWRVAARDTRTAVSGMAATAAATVVYEWTHFLTHTGYRPKGSWYRRLQRRHRLHHFKDEHLWYGFTVPFVDDLFRTAPDPTTVPTSPTVRTLGVTDEA